VTPAVITAWSYSLTARTERRRAGRQCPGWPEPPDRAHLCPHLPSAAHTSVVAEPRTVSPPDRFWPRSPGLLFALNRAASLPEAGV